MKKIIITMLLLATIFTFDGILDISAIYDDYGTPPSDQIYVNEGGIEKIIHINKMQTEITMTCDYPELFMRNYYTADVCYLYTEEVLKADINGDAFYKREYDVIEWEYDWSVLDQKYPIYYVDEMYSYTVTGDDYNNVDTYGDNIIESRIFSTYLPSVYVDGTHFAFYKSQIIKYNPELFNEIEVVLGLYENLVDEQRIASKEAAMESLDNAKDELIGTLSDVEIYGKQLDSIELYLEIITGGDGVFDALVDRTAGRMELADKACDVFDDKLNKELLEDLCELAFDHVDFSDLTSGEIKTIIREFFQQDIEMIIAKTAFEVGAKLFYESAKDYIPGLGTYMSAAKITYHLTEALINYAYSEEMASFLESLEPVKEMFSVENALLGKNLRIDYVIDRVKLINPTTVLETSADFEDFAKRSTTKLVFSQASNDVLEDDIFNSYTQSLYGKTRTDNASGKLSLLTGSQFAAEFKDVVLVEENEKPVQIIKANNIYRYYQSTNNKEHVETTDYKNAFYTIEPNSYTPILNNSNPVYATTKTIGGELEYTFRTNYDNLVSSTIIICKGSYNLDTQACPSSNLVYNETFPHNNYHYKQFQLENNSTLSYIIIVTYENGETGTNQKYIAKKGKIYTSQYKNSNQYNTYLSTNTEYTTSIKFNLSMTDLGYNYDVTKYRIEAYRGTYYRTAKEFSISTSTPTVSNLYTNTTYRFDLYTLVVDRYGNEFWEFVDSHNETTLRSTSTGGGGGGGGGGIITIMTH